MQVARGKFEDGAARQRLHLVDQLGDPVNLIGDQPGQRQVLAFQFAPEQLRRAANPGQRVLDFVRQDLGRAQHPALARHRSIAQRFRPANVGQGNNLPAGLFDQRRCGQVDPSRWLARYRDPGSPGGKMGIGIGQTRGDARLVETQYLADLASIQAAETLPQQLFGGRVG